MLQEAPGRGEGLEDYLEKFRYELKRQAGRPYGLITWRSLVTEEKKGGGRIAEHYMYIKEPLYRALANRGLLIFHNNTL